jgi:1-phosphofructokinase family hexose kinase
MILTVTLNPAVDFTVFGGPFSVHRTNRGSLMPADPGGKGNNVARVARSLGADVTATGLTGGFTGAFIDEALSKEGITTAFFEISGVTRFTAAYIEEGSGAETKIVPDGPLISDREVQGFVDHYGRLVKTGEFSIIVLSGSLPRGVPADFYHTLIETADTFGTPVILDTSGQALREAAARPPLMIKPNLTEAMELAGTERPDEVFSVLTELSRTIPIIALTMGGEGAVFFSDGPAVKITSEASGAVNPVGAGDAFVGGFSAAYDRFGDDRKQLFRWASAAGTASARSAGLLFSPDTFEKAMAALVIEETAR